jgi:hypothetical protein
MSLDARRASEFLGSIHSALGPQPQRTYQGRSDRSFDQADPWAETVKPAEVLDRLGEVCGSVHEQRGEQS